MDTSGCSLLMSCLMTDEWVTVMSESPWLVSDRAEWVTVTYEWPWLMSYRDLWPSLSKSQNTCQGVLLQTNIRLCLGWTMFYFICILSKVAGCMRKTRMSLTANSWYTPHHTATWPHRQASRVSRNSGFSWWLVVSWDVSSLNGFHAHSTATVSFSDSFIWGRLILAGR